MTCLTTPGYTSLPLLHTCVFLLVTAEFNYLGAVLDLEKAEGKDEGGRVALTFSGTNFCLVMVS